MEALGPQLNGQPSPCTLLGSVHDGNEFFIRSSMAEAKLALLDARRSQLRFASMTLQTDRERAPCRPVAPTPARETGP